MCFYAFDRLIKKARESLDFWPSGVGSRRRTCRRFALGSLVFLIWNMNLKTDKKWITEFLDGPHASEETVSLLMLQPFDIYGPVRLISIRIEYWIMSVNIRCYEMHLWGNMNPFCSNCGRVVVSCSFKMGI